MTLKLHYHPFASFCQKALIALYENGVPFEREIIDLGDPGQHAAFERVWPIAKFPVLVDEAAGLTIPESTIIIDYLDRHHPAPAPLVPADPDAALQARLWDRFFDNYVHAPMQRIVAETFRSQADPEGVAQARALLATAYKVAEQQLAEGAVYENRSPRAKSRGVGAAQRVSTSLDTNGEGGSKTGRQWATGDAFTLADCAAAPALFYANIVAPFGAHRQLAAYYKRLLARPSFARVVDEARPYRHLFPLEWPADYA